MCIYVYMFLSIAFRIFKDHQVHLYKDWDLATITAGDYTVEFDIKRETYKYWQKHYHDKKSPLTECA